MKATGERSDPLHTTLAHFALFLNGILDFVKRIKGE